jgi:hypothetical protein
MDIGIVAPSWLVFLAIGCAIFVLALLVGVEAHGQLSKRRNSNDELSIWKDDT